MKATPEWLVLCFSVPAQPSALRVATWRTLKQAGAVSLGTGVYTLPNRESLLDLLQQLGAKINGGGGSAFVLLAQPACSDDQAALLERVAAARADDYAQVVKSAVRFVEHVARETSTEDFRFVEVESLEEEMEKVRRQLQRVIGRDFFESAAQETARKAVADAERALTDYIELASERGEP